MGADMTYFKLPSQHLPERGYKPGTPAVLGLPRNSRVGHPKYDAGILYYCTEISKFVGS
jgi:hypothetical protein